MRQEEAQGLGFVMTGCPIDWLHGGVQASGVAEELMKTEFDAARVIYNRFKSAIAYKPTIATVLSPDVSTLNLQ